MREKESFFSQSELENTRLRFESIQATFRKPPAASSGGPPPPPDEEVPTFNPVARAEKNILTSLANFPQKDDLLNVFAAKMSRMRGYRKLDSKEAFHQICAEMEGEPLLNEMKKGLTQVITYNLGSVKNSGVKDSDLELLTRTMAKFGHKDRFERLRGLRLPDEVRKLLFRTVMADSSLDREYEIISQLSKRKVEFKRQLQLRTDLMSMVALTRIEVKEVDIEKALTALSFIENQYDRIPSDRLICSAILLVDVLDLIGCIGALSYMYNAMPLSCWATPAGQEPLDLIEVFLEKLERLSPEVSARVEKYIKPVRATKILTEILKRVCDTIGFNLFSREIVEFFFDQLVISFVQPFWNPNVFYDLVIALFVSGHSSLIGDVLKTSTFEEYSLLIGSRMKYVTLSSLHHDFLKLAGVQLKIQKANSQSRPTEQEKDQSLASQLREHSPPSDFQSQKSGIKKIDSASKSIARISQNESQASKSEIKTQSQLNQDTSHFSKMKDESIPEEDGVRRSVNSQSRSNASAINTSSSLAKKEK